MQNSVINSRNTSLHGFQTTPVVLCMPNNVISINSMGPRPHLSFCAWKATWLASEVLVSMGATVICCFFMQNMTFGYELQISMGPRPHLWFCACKTAWLAVEILVSMCPRPQLSFCACKTTRLASELLVSLGSSPHLWCLHAKQLLLDQNYRSLWVPDFAWRFVHVKQRD